MHDPRAAGRGRPRHRRAAGPRAAPRGVRGRASAADGPARSRPARATRPTSSCWTSGCPGSTGSRCAGGSAGGPASCPVLDPHGARRRGRHGDRARRRCRRLRHQAVPAGRAAGPGAGRCCAAAPATRVGPRACASTSMPAGPGCGDEEIAADLEGVRPAARCWSREAGKVVPARADHARGLGRATGSGSTKTLDMHVSWLRRKLGDDAHARGTSRPCAVSASASSAVNDRRRAGR